MDFDPSRDWDRYNDEMERQAMEQFVGSVHELARDLYVHSGLAFSDAKIRAEQAYDGALGFLMAQAEMDHSIRHCYSTKKLPPEDKNWSDRMIDYYEDLLP